MLARLQLLDMQSQGRQEMTIGNGAYKVQLLLSEDGARFVRKMAMKAATEWPDVTQEEEDMAYAIIAEIAQGLRR